MRVLGLSAFYHDSAAALVVDGAIVAAAQEERFTRKKLDAGYPKLAVEYCLSAAGIGLEDLEFVVFYDKPFIKFERLLETYLTFSPRGFNSFRMAMPLWLREKLFQKSLLAGELKAVAPDFDWQKRLLFCEHHLSHAASAFFPSPFEQAAVLTLDGVGEWATTAAATGAGNELSIHKEIHFPHSLGLLYSAFTYYTGFKVNSGEYKLMGLAPYGTPRYARLIRDNLIDLKADGSFRLNLDYFNYCTGLTMTNERFDALFGGPPRDPETWLEQKHMDIAASVQVVLEEAVLRLTRRRRRPECKIFAWPAGSRSIAWPMARFFATARSATCGFNLRAARWALRSPPITCMQQSRARSRIRSTRWQAPISARNSPRTTSKAGCKEQARASPASTGRQSWIRRQER
jgi:carbamoyltransferase